jgi:hypothetical protein
MRQKRQMERAKLKVIEKHMKMEMNLQKQKETRAHLIEYNRIANELRL